MTNEYCFACGKLFKDETEHFLVDTRDGQTVYVGPECYTKIVKAGEEGFQPTRYKGKKIDNMQRLWLLRK